MPERAINTKSATGCLLILLPAALAMSALFVAWPFILGVTLLIAGGNIWQNYEWTKTARSIDPVFQQLVTQNRGEISPIDLSLTANISAKVSQKYLAIRASEFGTGSRQHPDRGQIYYFVSISTLGSIFDDSESDAPALTAAATPLAALPPSPISTPPAPEESTPVVAITTIPAIVEPTPPPETASAPATEPVSDLSNLRQLFNEEAPPASAAVEHTPEPPITADPPAPVVTIIQSELAKRLDVHSSTIYKRRSEPGFTDWTRNRDPDGLAWGYAEAAKEYYQIIDS